MYFNITSSDQIAKQTDQQTDIFGCAPKTVNFSAGFYIVFFSFRAKNAY